MSNESGFAILVTHLTAMAFGCEVHFPVCWCRNAALKSITPSLKRRPGCLFSEYAGWAYLEQVSWAKLHLLALALDEHLNKLPSVVDDFWWQHRQRTLLGRAWQDACRLGGQHRRCRQDKRILAIQLKDIGNTP